MKRLIKFSGSRARSYDTSIHTHTDGCLHTVKLVCMHVLMFTYTMRARLYLASWPCVPRRTVSQRSSSASYHAALPCPSPSLRITPFLSFSLTPRFLSPRSSLACRLARRISCSIYLSSSPHRDTDADRRAEQCTLSSDQPWCNARCNPIAKSHGSNSSLSIEYQVPPYTFQDVPRTLTRLFS